MNRDLPPEILSELHRIQRQLAELKSRLARGPKQITAAEADLANRNAALAEAKEVLKRTKMAADEKELQLREREGRIEDVKRKLNSCSSNREYQALLEQIAADQQANSVLSDEILELFEKVSEEEHKVSESEKRSSQGKEELEKLKARVDDQRDSLENDLARLDKELKSTEEKLPADIRPDYERLVKARGDDGMAPLEGECCGGCFQQVTQQTINELRLSQFVLCKSCGRVLYFREDTRVR